MSERETAEAINEQAMRWVARLDREGSEGDLQAELETWLAADPRRQGAFLRAEAAWGVLDRAGVLTPEVEEAPPTRRRLLVGGGMAAAAVAMSGGWLTYRAVRGVSIKTAKGEIRRVPLADGSMAIVNTDTSVRVDLQPDLRAVALDDGEAWFQVAKDGDRPFVVKIGDVRVRAVGTAFSVRRLPGGAVVQVTEGVVETWCVGKEAAVVRVAAGGKALVAPEAAPAVTRDAEQIDRNLAWRTGLIVLDGDTLGQAAAEFNRYNDRQIVIEDNELASQTYVGRFRTNEPEAFVRSVALTLGAKAQETPDAFLIYRE